MRTAWACPPCPLEIDIVPIADDDAETVQNANTAAPDGEPQYTGWRLDKEERKICALLGSAACGFRKTDQNFVAALVRSALVDRKLILSRLPTADERTVTENRPLTPGHLGISVRRLGGHGVGVGVGWNRQPFGIMDLGYCLINRVEHGRNAAK
jgi:hypothetical protein